MDDESEKIIIRRRRSDGEEDHHGGVWKLAFADFMTAMMAFFLVMWLINSTSKETKATIVQYFNPVQLVDTSPNKKGLRDPNDGGQGTSSQRPVTGAHEKAEHESASSNTQEAALHQEPIKVLDEIAKINPPVVAAQQPESYGEMLADPFDRTHHNSPTPAIEQNIADSTNNSRGDKHVGKDSNQPEAALNKVIEDALKIEVSGKDAPSFEVRKTSEGILIDLMDNVHFSMFDVGSIKPSPQLVRMLAQLAPTLEKYRGEIEISGHTDARNYKTKSYDNWRLSAERANMIYYMLVRGGLPEKRVTKISGYADRKLKDSKAPLSAVNRRIEILIRGSGR